ncbi:hypothetical protein [Loktanella sp. S4079]|uniref:hypothetical protein n=1 Tax=Loktanella sp. S4079 TaxID=579483 RepID=UPI000A8B312F|nr:hypothetical protein [Loktanella sp. S4079]
MSDIVFVVLGFGFCGAIILGFWYLRYLFARQVQKWTNQRDSKGQEVEQTGFAKTQLGNLPADVGFVAGVGKNAEPAVTLNVTILRPTIGMRLISIGVGGAIIWMIWLSETNYLPDIAYLDIGTSIVVAYSLLYTNLYELRYDQHGIIHKDWFLREVEFRWRDIISIKDNGQYAYILRLENGKKTEVLKYLVGIRPFLTYAKEQIAKNNRM